MNKNLIVDLNNIAIVKRYGMFSAKETMRTKRPYYIPTMFNSIIKDILNTVQRLKCKSIMLTHDTKGSLKWRKSIYPQYKVKETVNDDVYREDTYTVIDLVTAWFEECTAAAYIECNTAEADDIISVWTRSNAGHDIIMSTDKDYIQLVGNNTDLYNPVTKEYRQTEDAAYELFLKCFRGDKSDNIPNIYPRLRETVIKDAYSDTIARMNLMHDKNPNGETVYDLYERNNQLMNLRRIPKHVEDDIIESILPKLNRTTRFNEVKSRSWVGQNVGETAHTDIFGIVALSTPCIIY